jgi:hypothetical protein
MGKKMNRAPVVAHSSNASPLGNALPISARVASGCNCQFSTQALKSYLLTPSLIRFVLNQEDTMAQTVKLSDELVEDAKRIAAVEHRSVPRQIEFYFRMALIAEENPDLSFSLIREIMKADAEDAVEEYTFG